MVRWLKSMFGVAEPAGPPVSIRRFRPTDPTLSRDGIAVEQEGWVVDAREGQTVRLFEAQDPQVEHCVVTYRAKMKTEGLDGRAFLEMWCRLPGRGEFFSRGVDQAVEGTTDWVSCEIPFYLKKGQRPDLIKLNLAIEGSGRVWIRDMELLKTPLS